MQPDEIQKLVQRILYNVPRIGNIFIVNGVSGDDHNLPAKKPETPLLKIATALGQCANDNDDYIFVIDCWQQDTFPIVVNKTRVHIIGIVNKSNRFPVMAPTGDTAIFTIGSLGNDCEIAGFNLGGGANHGCIELSNPIGLWIHDIIFGSQHAGGTPQDGIAAISPHDPIHGLIGPNCKFYGSGNNSNGLLTRDGIRNIGGGAPNFRNMTVKENIFLGVPGIGIDLDFAQGAMLIKNQFALPSDTEGKAITLGGKGCWVDDNHANYGDTTMTANPFKDTAAAGANTWGLNHKGGTSIMPA